MHVFKIIFTGPVGAGKTTAIRTLCGDTLSTEAVATDMTSGIKTHTTVAMDYGTLRFGNNKTLHIYGTPWQERFNFMWDILSEGSLGIIFLFSLSRNNILKDIDLFMTSFSENLINKRIAIGFTHYTEKDHPRFEEAVRHIHSLNLPNAKIMITDTRLPKDLASLIESIII